MIFRKAEKFGELRAWMRTGSSAFPGQIQAAEQCSTLRRGTEHRLDYRYHWPKLSQRNCEFRAHILDENIQRKVAVSPRSPLNHLVADACFGIPPESTTRARPSTRDKGPF